MIFFLLLEFGLFFVDGLGLKKGEWVENGWSREWLAGEDSGWLFYGQWQMRRFLDIFETQILRTCDISDSSGLVLTMKPDAIPAAYCKARSQHHHWRWALLQKGHGAFLVVFSPRPFWYTPAKFNMEPENDGFQEELPFLGTSSQVPC